MKITLPMTPAKIATYAFLALYGVATVAVAIALFDPEEAAEKTNLAYVVTPAMTALAAVAWVFFLSPRSARLAGTVLTVREPRRLEQVDLATVTRTSLDEPGPVLVLHLDEGESLRLPLSAAKDAERAAIAGALDGNEQPAAKETAARLRMPSAI